ncbi:unnamed protein product [Trichobilharzia regenti]|nr:unnamed protein product [Trichobilharzia regenti]
MLQTPEAIAIRLKQPLGQTPKVDVPVINKNKEAEEKLKRKQASSSAAKKKNDTSTSPLSQQPSEALVTKKKLAKRRLKSALDVLIPPKEF